LVATDPLNDRISSIRVPKGLVALVYEHANEAGGFGISATSWKTALTWHRST